MTELDLQRHSIQFAKGFRRLRFDGALELEFRQVFFQRGLLRQRSAITLGVLLLLSLASLDLPNLSADQKDFYLWSRIYTACPLLVISLILTFLLDNLVRYFQWVALIIISYIGMVTNAMVLMVNVQAPVLPYEGINLIMMTCFLLAGLLFRYAIFCNALIVFSYFAMAAWFNSPVTPYQVFFIAGHFAVGATGGYIIEFNSRYNFLQQGMLATLAKTDALTGIFNRGALNEKLRDIFDYALREKKHVTLLMADIDYFKRYNDLYGHIEGDHCIINVAKALAGCCRRPLDFVGRYGGEEFLLLWFDTHPDESATLHETFRQQIEDLHIPHTGSDIAPYVTVSGGMVTGQPDSPTALEHYLQAADDCLYRAKTAGRNQVVSRLL